MLVDSAIGSYRIERIGDWIDPAPRPLSAEFIERLAATVAAYPAVFGRLFSHVREGSR